MHLRADTDPDPSRPTEKVAFPPAPTATNSERCTQLHFSPEIESFASKRRASQQQPSAAETPLFTAAPTTSPDPPYRSAHLAYNLAQALSSSEVGSGTRPPRRAAQDGAPVVHAHRYPSSSHAGHAAQNRWPCRNIGLDSLPGITPRGDTLRRVSDGDPLRQGHGDPLRQGLSAVYQNRESSAARARDMGGISGAAFANGLHLASDGDAHGLSNEAMAWLRGESPACAPGHAHAHGDTYAAPLHQRDGYTGHGAHGPVWRGSLDARMNCSPDAFDGRGSRGARKRSLFEPAVDPHLLCKSQITDEDMNAVEELLRGSSTNDYPDAALQVRLLGLHRLSLLDVECD